MFKILQQQIGFKENNIELQNRLYCKRVKGLESVSEVVMKMASELRRERGEQEIDK